jgi:uncharacterized protein (TIGR02145 family)
MKHIYLFIFALFFYSLSYSQIPCPGIPTVDYAGKTYHTVQIGGQCWLKENLDVGEQIIYDQTNNGTIEKYCYLDDKAYCTTYGGLYQWAEAMQYSKIEGSQGICPNGWHIPTVEDFNFLLAYTNNTGQALISFVQGTKDTAGINKTGFSSLLSGNRLENGSFTSRGVFEELWSSSIHAEGDIQPIFLCLAAGGGGDLLRTWKNYGFSIRCIH